MRLPRKSSTSGLGRACLRVSLPLLTALCLAACSQPEFRDTSGRGYAAAELQGKWLVINYWATWCAPCLTEIPELVALNDSRDDLQVFGVNFDNPEGEEAARQIARMGITFPVLAADPHARYGAQRPEALPTTLIISPAGALVATLVGPQTQESLLAVMASR